MRLPAFAEAYRKQINQEAAYQSISFHERLMLLVDAEYNSRLTNNIKRLIKNTKFSDSSAFLGNIDYLPDRHLNRDLLKTWQTIATPNKVWMSSLSGLQVPVSVLSLMHLGLMPASLDTKQDISGYRNCSANWIAARIQGKYIKWWNSFKSSRLLSLMNSFYSPHPTMNRETSLSW